MRLLWVGIIMLAAGLALAAEEPAKTEPAAATVPSVEPLQKKIEAIGKDAVIPADQKAKAVQAEVDAARKTVGGKTWSLDAVVKEVKRVPVDEGADRLDVTVTVPQLGLEGIVLAKDVPSATSGGTPTTLYATRVSAIRGVSRTPAGDPQMGDTVKVGVGCDVVLAEGKASLVVREMHLAGSSKSRFFDPPLAAKPDAAKAPAASGGGSFFGVGTAETAKLQKVVYIVDRSGSMTDSIDFVKYELKRSIATLTDEQEFHVIFFSSGPPVEMPTRRLVNATERNKQLAFQFIDGIVPQGETDPSKALDRAFACQPELVYLLTDGEFDKAIVDQVKRLNAAGKTKIHTVAFLYQSGADVLKDIAKDSGGNFKLVTEQDLANLAK